MIKRKLIFLTVVSIFLLFCIIFKSDFTISHANVETSLNPGIVVKFKSPSSYGMNDEETVDATKIVSYKINLKSVDDDDDEQYLHRTFIYTDRGYMPEYSLSWRKNSDINKIVSGDNIENLSKTNQDLCIKIDKDNIKELKHLTFYKVGIIAYNNFGQRSFEKVIDTHISALQCANIPPSMCWANFKEIDSPSP